MLRLSSDCLHISFASSGFKLEKYKGLFRPKRVDAALVRVKPTTGVSPWVASLQALQVALSEARWQGLPISIVVSDQLVRYQLLPSLREVATPKERLAYAIFYFQQIYGNVAENWEIKVDASFPDMPAIACGMDKELLNGLLAFGQIKKSVVRSIMPRFVATINRAIGHIHRIKDQRFVIALFESGNITSCLVEGGQWHSIRQRFVRSSPIDSLQDALEQDRLASSFQHDETKVYLLNWPELTEEALSNVDSRWHLLRYDLPNTSPDVGA